MLTDSYPGIAKLHGPVGVRTVISSCRMQRLTVFQHRMLYVFDPVAMHNILVKDQYIYEEAAWFVRYAIYVHELT